ncbi:MAG: hypothetical protein ACYC5A_09980 [Thermoleophilia bacterium]
MPDRLKKMEVLEAASLLAIIIFIILLSILATDYYGESLREEKLLVTLIPYIAIAGFLFSRFLGLIRLGQTKAYISRRSHMQVFLVTQIFLIFVTFTVVIAILIANHVSLLLIFHTFALAIISYYSFYFTKWWSIRKNGVSINNLSISWTAITSISWSERDSNIMILETKKRHGRYSIKVRIPLEERKQVIDQLVEKFPEIESYKAKGTYLSN